VQNAAEAISLGAEGYLLKSVQPRYLAEAIRIVYDGGTLVSMDTARLLMSSGHESVPPAAVVSEPPRIPGPGYALTDKEIEIVQCLADGLKYKDIAQKLHFSESTIKNYVSIIYSKLNVDNRMQAVKKAQEKLLL
jgi:DNA-binding NarL/FixJ family response regulator